MKWSNKTWFWPKIKNWLWLSMKNFVEWKKNSKFKKATRKERYISLTTPLFPKKTPWFSMSFHLFTATQNKVFLKLANLFYSQTIHGCLKGGWMKKVTSLDFSIVKKMTLFPSRRKICRTNQTKKYLLSMKILVQIFFFQTRTN